jgi:hypothetical protein
MKMEKQTQHKNYTKKRRHTRFKPDATSMTLVEFNPSENEFRADSSALTLEESFSGCCIILALKISNITENIWRVRVGDFAPLLAEVVWVKNLDENIYKVGLKYLP